MSSRNRLDGKKVLIVDDEPDILETVEDLLPMCHIKTASTFNEARTLLGAERFDLAILDIMGVDGYSLLDIARANQTIAVMLTAYAQTPENIKKSYKNGAAFFIPKEELINITLFLEDVLEALEKGKNAWSRWFERLGAHFDRRFGVAWKDEEREIWRNIKY